MYVRKESYDTAWLKAERDLAISGYGIPSIPSAVPSSTDEPPTDLGDYNPGASRPDVFKALKKVATSPKPS